ncbi:MAG: phosphoenolpyruvate--protein phosphotransferase [Treponema sp.]|jgi:phosphotransferase system enzyme I (PtsI)|nr:phosphoenolpyruvate--protein phosphotransferase [Treponema sp.]
MFPGIAFGIAWLFKRQELSIDESPSVSPKDEWDLFEAAKKRTDEELEAIYEKTKAEIGEEDANIIDVQRMILEDGDFLEAVEDLIENESFRAAHAVTSAGKRFADFFAGLEDPYMKARSADMADVSRRIVELLLDRRESFVLHEPSVIVAEDLSPSETLQLDKKLIRAFVTRRGSTNSHTAILARTFKIPSLVQAEIPLDDDMNGRAMAVDGHEGAVYLEPDEETFKRLEARQRRDEEERRELERMRGLPTVTRDGRKLELFVNIGGVEDMEAALNEDAEGIGLFRSEFLYLGREAPPGEEEQFNAYRRVAEGMGGKKVVIRTMDIGADKQAAWLGLEEEANPALGCRAIRICFDRPDLFRTQLRAIYRASAYGKIAVMFPMITSLWELQQCRKTAEAVRRELSDEGVRTGDVELGIMIETPAAALCAAELAREADFFSVGTNDLTQYTLAIDRQNEKLDRFMDTRHPALLRLLRMIVEDAHKAGIWVGICGELAADPEMTGRLIEMGYDELSVSPAFVLKTRKRIREMNSKA